jgi:hypothetical protein
MKVFNRISLILFIAFFVSAYAFAQNNGKADKPSKYELINAHYIQGQITIKLKEGVGEFEKQEGMVYLGIPSLDEKINAFNVYKLEHRFRYNKRLLNERTSGLSRIYRLYYTGDQSLKTMIKAFKADPNVEYAEGVPKYIPMSIPNDSLYAECQHLPQIQAEEAWDIHKGEDGAVDVVIAIIDTGVDWDHEDLVANTWQNLAEDADGDGVTIEFINDEWVLDPDDLDGVDDDDNGYTDDLVGWNFINENGDPNPTGSNAHGTHCAGIACGSTNNGVGASSISYNLKHMGVCMSAGGDGGPYAFDAVLYAAENGADIISFSWGGWAYSQATQEGLHYVQDLGSIFVAAAGNNNSENPFYPAAYLHTIAVAAVDEEDQRSSFSNYGYYIDVSAPGGDLEDVEIWSTVLDNQYEEWSGTSMATPIISGSLGLLKSYHPTWSNEELLEKLLSTSDYIDSLNLDYEYKLGTGRVNAYEMLLCENFQDPYLKLGLEQLIVSDANESNVIDAGETAVLDFDVRNFMQTYGADNAVVTLTSSDPDVTITDGDGMVNIPADSIFQLIDQFEIEIADDAEAHMADFNLHFEADLPIVVGQDMPFSLLIAPSGYFVYDGDEDGEDYSGQYIYDYLIEHDLPALYASGVNFPASLSGFDGAFFSFGNYNSGNTAVDDHYADVITAYMESGGDVYLEGGDVLGYDQSDNSEFLALFGLVAATDGGTNPIDELFGEENALADGMVFTSNTQSSNSWIDQYFPLDEAEIAFTESGYGDVAVQYDAGDERQSFCFSYAISKLVDDSLNTRDDLMNQILVFFGMVSSVDEVEKDPFSCAVFPNPTSSQNTISYVLPKGGEVRFEIVNSIGQTVERMSEFQAQGAHRYDWNADNLPSGLYYYSLTVDSQRSVGEIILVK